MQYLLDTNTCIDVMRNHPNVVNHLSAVAPGDCVVSTITSYELHTGIAKCTSPDKEQVKVTLFLKTVLELPFDQAAAREAGRIRAQLESRGEMIGPYDILLGAQALATGLTLVTANTNEFQRVQDYRSRIGKLNYRETIAKSQTRQSTVQSSRSANS